MAPIKALRRPIVGQGVIKLREAGQVTEAAVQGLAVLLNGLSQLLLAAVDLGQLTLCLGGGGARGRSLNTTIKNMSCLLFHVSHQNKQ